VTKVPGQTVGRPLRVHESTDQRAGRDSCRQPIRRLPRPRTPHRSVRPAGRSRTRPTCGPGLRPWFSRPSCSLPPPARTCASHTLKFISVTEKSAMLYFAVSSRTAVGRESAPKLLGGASGSVLAGWGGLSVQQRRLLVACGGPGSPRSTTSRSPVPCSPPRSSSAASPCRSCCLIHLAGPVQDRGSPSSACREGTKDPARHDHRTC